MTVAGYVCLIESKNDIHKDDLEEVLNMLAVGDLREIISTMNKVCKFLIIQVVVVIMYCTSLKSILTVIAKSI